jgi:hypothetical protein
MKKIKEQIKNELIKQYECALSYPNPDLNCETWFTCDQDIKINKIYNEIISEYNNKNKDGQLEIIWTAIDNNN